MRTLGKIYWDIYVVYGNIIEVMYTTALFSVCFLKYLYLGNITNSLTERNGGEVEYLIPFSMLSRFMLHGLLL